MLQYTDMEKEIISSMVVSLPEAKIGEIQQDHEIWEETDGGAHFKVTRHNLQTSNGDMEILAMSISGHFRERKRVIDEFSEVLGDPIVKEPFFDKSLYIDTIVWQIDSQD